MQRRASSGKYVASFAWLSVRNAIRSRRSPWSPASDAATASTTSLLDVMPSRRGLGERGRSRRLRRVTPEVVPVGAEDVDARGVELHRHVVARLERRVRV